PRWKGGGSTRAGKEERHLSQAAAAVSADFSNFAKHRGKSRNRIARSRGNAAPRVCPKRHSRTARKFHAPTESRPRPPPELPTEKLGNGARHIQAGPTDRRQLRPPGEGGRRRDGERVSCPAARHRADGGDQDHAGPHG